MDNIGKLSEAVKLIYKKAEEAQNPSDVGAKLGIMNSATSVTISGQSYYAISVCRSHLMGGVRVWCQLADNYRAVVIGLA